MTDNPSDNRAQDGRQVATLAGGCFWCLEAVYPELAGVHSVKSGYAGGHKANPTYQEVCSGSTGHTEVVQVEFDPAVITYRDLLDVFFSVHDPTTKDRQGNDVGTQYRSAIFAHDDEQMRTAREAIADLEAADVYSGKVVTEVTKAATFYPAEAYHDNYYARNPEQGYCQVIIAPKVAKFRKQHLGRLRRSDAATAAGLPG
ncbi:MAG TPA: peptide-methionine (S)-S-oxide reductase MsrA [Trueperaceae bacterium]|nr:peptide-methionine (S)-S-oxide reductase MsrA [Trueperaceae bacterium]